MTMRESWNSLCPPNEISTVQSAVRKIVCISLALSSTSCVLAPNRCTGSSAPIGSPCVLLGADMDYKVALTNGPGI